MFCWKALTVFSPTLKIYFAESKVTKIDGSVSEERLDRTEEDQFEAAMW
jgi:hypothetical protein